MFDQTGLAHEIADAIDRSDTGEVRVRWSTQNGTRVVEVIRSGTWSHVTRSNPQIKSARPITAGSARSRKRDRRAEEVRKILGLMEVFGPDAVKLDVVRRVLGLPKTSAHYRLAEARALWDPSTTNESQTALNLNGSEL